MTRWRVLALLFAARLPIGLQFQSVSSAGQPLVDELGLSAPELGALIGLYVLPGIAVALPGGILTTRLDNRILAILALALMALGSAALAIASNYPALMAGRLMGGFGFAILTVVLTKMTADWFVGQELTAAMGVLLASWPCGVALGLCTQPRLVETSGLRVEMQATAGLCVVAMLLIAVCCCGVPVFWPRSERVGARPTEPRCSRQRWLALADRALRAVLEHLGRLADGALGLQMAPSAGQWEQCGAIARTAESNDIRREFDVIDTLQPDVHVGDESVDIVDAFGRHHVHHDLSLRLGPCARSPTTGNLLHCVPFRWNHLHRREHPCRPARERRNGGVARERRPRSATAVIISGWVGGDAAGPPFAFLNTGLIAHCANAYSDQARAGS